MQYGYRVLAVLSATGLRELTDCFNGEFTMNFESYSDSNSSVSRMSNLNKLSWLYGIADNYFLTDLLYSNGIFK